MPARGPVPVFHKCLLPQIVLPIFDERFGCSQRKLEAPQPLVANRCATQVQFGKTLVHKPPNCLPHYVIIASQALNTLVGSAKFVNCPLPKMKKDRSGNRTSAEACNCHETLAGFQYLPITIFEKGKWLRRSPMLAAGFTVQSKKTAHRLKARRDFYP